MMAQTEDRQLLHAKRKAINSLFPYVLWQDRVGRQTMFGVLSRAAMTSDHEQFIWHRVYRSIYTPSNNHPGPPCLDLVITLGSPHVYWNEVQHDENMVTRWAAAATAVTYTEEVGRSVVDALLQIASVDSLRPHIPVGIWAWLKKRPSLPPECLGRLEGTKGDVVRHVRALGDIEVLKSYLLLVWSEWDPTFSTGFGEMCTSIREDFGGIGMGCHRKDLIERVDHVLGQLDQGRLEHEPGLCEWAKGQYGNLKETLLGVDREAMDVLTRTPPTLILFRSTDTYGYAQNPTQPSHALCLSHARSLFGTLGLYTGSYPVVAFPYTLPVGSEPPKFSLPTCYGVVDIAISLKLLFHAPVSCI